MARLPVAERLVFLAAVLVGGRACAFDPVATTAFSNEADARLGQIDEAGDAGADAGPLDLGRRPDAGSIVMTCGNGHVEGTETCDDHNREAGDGCTADCAIEAGWRCFRHRPSRCYLEGEVAFVDTQSPGCPDQSGDGSAARPFCFIQDAVNAAPPSVIIAASGRYTESIRIEGGARLELLARTAITVDGAPNLTLEVRDQSSLDATGVQFQGGPAGAVRIENQGTLARFSECEFGPSLGIGIRLVSDARIVVEQSRVFENRGGGIELNSGAGYEIRNTVVADNGAAAADFGGVQILQTNSSSEFVNNTVVGNIARPNAGRDTGIHCATPETSVVNSIVWDNGTPTGTSSLSLECAARYCNIGPGARTTGTNMGMAPRFAGDPWFHISADSPCRDAADPAGTRPNGGPAPRTDLDGESRPEGAQVDIGADEVVPSAE